MQVCKMNPERKIQNIARPHVCVCVSLVKPHLYNFDFMLEEIREAKKANTDENVPIDFEVRGRIIGKVHTTQRVSRLLHVGE